MCPPAEVAHLQLPSRDLPRRPLLSPARLLLAAAAGCWLAALLLLLRASNFSLATLADQITEPYAFCSASFDAVAASFVLVFTTPLLAPRFALPFSLAVAGFLTAKPVCAAATDPVREGGKACHRRHNIANRTVLTLKPLHTPTNKQLS